MRRRETGVDFKVNALQSFIPNIDYSSAQVNFKQYIRLKFVIFMRDVLNIIYRSLVDSYLYDAHVSTALY